jgi:KaiC/GvpD/RAD55 family RecA-like ATPase/transcriptional regulator with XRE-family HTH domain
MGSDRDADVPADSPFSLALRRQLRAHEWSQRELAEFLGKHESTVSLWLSGQSSPRSTDALVSRLAEFLGQTIEEVEALLREAGTWVAKGSEFERIGTMDQFMTVCRGHPSVRPLLSSGVLYSHSAIVNRFKERGYEVDPALVDEYRNRFMKEDRGSPGVTQDFLKTKAGSGFLAASGWEALDMFRTLFRRDGWMRATIRAVCDRLNREFEGSEREELPRATIVRLIDGCLGLDDSPDYRDVRRQLTTILLEALRWVRYLKPIGDPETADGFRRSWRLSASYLTNRLFGVEPRVEGLEFLLDGGLLPPTRTGLSILLDGEPGTGKTTLSLQLAASLAAQGYAVVYLAAEEDPVTLEERLGFAGFDTRVRLDDQTIKAQRGGVRDEGEGVHEGSRGARGEGAASEFKLRVANSTAALLDSAQADLKQGSFLYSVTISSIGDRSSAFRTGESEVLRNLEAFFKRLRESRTSERTGHFPEREIQTCLIVDSVDAVLPEQERRELEDLFNFGRYHTDVCVLVSEGGPSQHGSVQPRASEHLADMVINLGYRSRLEWFSERVLEIKKCRTQAHIRGQHMFSIHTGGGATIYPSVQSKLSVWRRRVRRNRIAHPVSWRLDDSFDYDPIFKGDLFRGDSILVMGEPATHKLPLGLSFLAAGLSTYPADHTPGENLLLISLREDEAGVRQIADNYPQLRGLSEALDGADQGPRLKVMHFPPDYFSAERCLHWVERTLREMKSRGESVSRVLFNSLGQLRHSSPMFSKEPLLVAALIELFKKDSITSMFISVGPGRAPLTHLGGSGDGIGGDTPFLLEVDDGQRQEIGNIFDTIIFTGKNHTSGREAEVLLTIGHTGKCNADRDPVILKRPTIPDPGNSGRWIGRLELHRV